MYRCDVLVDVGIDLHSIAVPLDSGPVRAIRTDTALWDLATDQPPFTSPWGDEPVPLENRVSVFDLGVNSYLRKLRQRRSPGPAGCFMVLIRPRFTHLKRRELVASDDNLQSHLGHV